MKRSGWVSFWIMVAVFVFFTSTAHANSLASRESKLPITGNSPLSRIPANTVFKVRQSAGSIKSWMDCSPKGGVPTQCIRCELTPAPKNSAAPLVPQEYLAAAVESYERDDKGLCTPEADIEVGEQPAAGGAGTSGGPYIFGGGGNLFGGYSGYPAYPGYFGYPNSLANAEEKKLGRMAVEKIKFYDGGAYSSLVCAKYVTDCKGRQMMNIYHSLDAYRLQGALAKANGAPAGEISLDELAYVLRGDVEIVSPAPKRESRFRGGAGDGEGTSDQKPAGAAEAGVNSAG